MVVDHLAADVVARAAARQQVVGAVDRGAVGVACKQAAPRRLVAVVDTQHERWTEIKSVERVDMPLHSEIARQVVAAVDCVAESVLIACRVGKQILLVARLLRFLAAVGIHHIAAGAEYLVIAHIEIETYVLRIVHTVDTAEAFETSVAGHRERHLVDVVGVSHD